MSCGDCLKALTLRTKVLWLFEGIDVKKLMTPEEKAKLYAAIGYDEEDVDPNLPKQVIQCCSYSFIVIW